MADFYNNRSLLLGNTVPQFDTASIGRGIANLQSGLSGTYDTEVLNNKLKKQEEDRQYQRNRDALADVRYEADREERLNDKFDKKQRESMTNEALGLIGNQDSFLSGKISAENKAYADALSQVSDPAERARLEQDIKNYQSGQQRQSWIDTTLGQSNIDQGKVLDLKRQMSQDEESKRRFDLQLAETQALRAENRAERLAREQEKKQQSIAASIAAREFIGTPDVQSTVVEKSTGKLILDPSKQSEFNAINDKILQEKPIADRISKIEKLGNDILTPDQKTDEALRERWRQEYGDKLKESNISNIAGSVAEGIRYKSNNVDAAKTDLAEFLQTNTKDPIFGSKEQNDAYDKRLKELQNNLKKAELEDKNAPTINKESVPDFETYKKSLLGKSALAESRIVNENNELAKEYNNRVDKLLKTDGFGIEEKIKTEVPVNASDVAKNVFINTRQKMLDAGITDEAIINTEASKAAKLAADKQASVLDKARESATKKAAKVEEKISSQQEQAMKDRIDEIKTAEKSLDSYSKAKDQRDIIVNGEYLDPEEYIKYERDRIDQMKNVFRNKYPSYGSF